MGPWAAGRLIECCGERLPADVRIIDAGTAGMEVMFAARGVDKLYIIDACQGGGPPGSVFRVPGHELEADSGHGYTLHDFRWNHALHAGRKMYGGDFPRCVEVFLIEAAVLDFGLDLSDSARAGAEQVVQALANELLAGQS